MRKKHPNKEIEATICHAEKNGWTVTESKGHPWGSLRCPNDEADCRCGKYCRMSVWSTPKNTGNFARQLKRKIDGCIYEEDGELKKGDSNE